MLIHCPRCGREVPVSQLNVATDVGACRACDELFSLSERLQHESSAQVTLTPPPGAWLEKSAGGFAVGATTRSAIAFFMVPFMLVWSGGSLGGLYGRQIAQGHFDLSSSLFGVPFLLGAVLFWSITLMAIAGQATLTVRGDDAELFVGVGRIGLRRRFRWSEIRSVSEEPATMRYPGSQGTRLSLQGPQRYSFGSGISDSRRYFLLHTLRSLIKQAPSAPAVPYR